MIQKNIKRNKYPFIFIIVLLLTIIITPMLPKIAFAQDSEIPVSNLAFTSDVHGKTDHLKTWLLSLSSEGYTNLDYMVFGGDIDNKFNAETISVINNLVSAQYTQVANIFTMGNHEWQGSGSESAFFNATNCTRTGVQAEKQNYIIYTLGASSKTQKFTDNDIKKLDNYLSNTNSMVPVFIVSHYPLHIYGNKKEARETSNAKNLINVLNKYPNVIFLWGHNHTLSDTNYGTVKSIGDTIQYSSKKSKKINFTYANLGCMKDGAKKDAYGLLANIEAYQGSWTVKLQYRSTKSSIGDVTTISSLKNTDLYYNTMLSKIKVTPTQKTLYLGNKNNRKKKLTITLPEVIQIVETFQDTSIINGEIQSKLSFVSSNSKVATVSKTGQMKAIQEGNATIKTIITFSNGKEKVFLTKIVVKE